MPELNEDVLSWVRATVGRRVRIVDVTPLRDGTYLRVPWLIRMNTRDGPFDAILKIGSSEPGALRGGVTNVTLRDSFAAEALGLQIADDHSLPAPRLLGLDLDGASGGLAILSTALEGRTGAPDSSLMNAFGAAASALHAIPMSTSDGQLRTRPRPSDDEVFLRKWAAAYQTASRDQQPQIVQDLLAERPGLPVDGLDERLLRMTTSTLIQEAERRILGFTPDDEQAVLVHADLCSGNTIWSDSGLVGIIDWEDWGVGHYGVDLGNLRFEESMRFGLAAADDILRGWQCASGQDALNVAYWDLVAALNTPADLIRWSGGDPTATERRDRFLHAAIERFDRA
ncbi:MAG TPA: aminoglycoside phosphotransferase family protein [Mycobacteriales bacterium]|nr:aminoglycoside phosphotransferase family protein [Mycobacteriales bacterium]